MAEIVKQLQNLDFRFVRVGKRSKKPVGHWKQEENHLRYDNPKLIKHLDSEGNVGVLGGYGGLIVIDCDSQELVDRINDFLPQTLVEFTANGCHFFYLCDGINMYEKLDVGDKHYGEIRADKGHQTVVSPSIHETGKIYRIGGDVPIAKITKEQLLQMIRPYTETREVGWEGEEVNVPIENVIDTSDMIELTNGELQGKHPFHDSKTGQNFCVNLEKQLWHCFRHETGGNAMHLIGMKEGLLKCGETIDAIKFLKLAQICKDKYGINVIIENYDREVDTVQEMLTKELKPIEYYVDPLIPKGSLIIIGGKPGSFKSMLTLHMCLNIASGGKYLDMFDVEKNTKILLYDLENGKRVMTRRLRYLVNGGQKLKDSNFKISYDFNKRNIPQEMAFAEKFDIIILDSYRRFLKGEENKSDVPDIFYHEFLKPLRDKGKTVIVLHHFRKARPEDLTEEDIQDMFRGSSDIPAQFDLVIGLLKTQETKIPTGLKFKISMMIGKNRLGLAVQNSIIGVEKNDPEMKTSIDFIRYGHVSAEEEFNEYLFSLLEERTLKRQHLIEALKDKLRLSIPTIDRRLRDLIGIGVITKSKYGHYQLPLSDDVPKDNKVIKSASQSTLS